jgi:hypothetical protein
MQLVISKVIILRMFPLVVVIELHHLVLLHLLVDCILQIINLEHQLRLLSPFLPTPIMAMAALVVIIPFFIIMVVAVTVVEALRILLHHTMVVVEAAVVVVVVVVVVLHLTVITRECHFVVAQPGPNTVLTPILLIWPLILALVPLILGLPLVPTMESLFVTHCP